MFQEILQGQNCLELDSIRVVPYMTSNTTPYGKVSANSFLNESPYYYPYNAIDGNTNTWYTPAKNEAYQNYYWQYDFENEAKVVITEFTPTAISYNQNASNVYYDMQLLGYDGTSWQTLSDVSRIVGITLSAWSNMQFNIINKLPCSKIKLVCVGTNGGSMHVSGGEVFAMKEILIKGY